MNIFLGCFPGRKAVFQVNHLSMYLLLKNEKAFNTRKLYKKKIMFIKECECISTNYIRHGCRVIRYLIC